MDVVKGSRNQNEDKDDIEIRFMGVLQNVDVACTHASLTLLLALLLTTHTQAHAHANAHANNGSSSMPCNKHIILLP